MYVNNLIQPIDNRIEINKIFSSSSSVRKLTLISAFRSDPKYTTSENIKLFNARNNPENHSISQNIHTNNGVYIAN